MLWYYGIDKKLHFGNKQVFSRNSMSFERKWLCSQFHRVLSYRVQTECERKKGYNFRHQHTLCTF